MLREIWYTMFGFVRTFGALSLFFAHLLANTPSVLVRRTRLVVRQIHNAGAMSLVIIMVCGLFVGGVLGLQGFATLAKFNAEAVLQEVPAWSARAWLSQTQCSSVSCRS